MNRSTESATGAPHGVDEVRPTRRLLHWIHLPLVIARGLAASHTLMDSAFAGMTAVALAKGVYSARECVLGERQWIPASAGMTAEGVPAMVVSGASAFMIGEYPLIPAFAGMTIPA